jgi:hypothetical protein
MKKWVTVEVLVFFVISLKNLDNWRDLDRINLHPFSEIL